MCYIFRSQCKQAEATVLLNASRACYDHPGDADGRTVSLQQHYPMALNGSAFLFSSAKNKFVSIGCPEHAYFVDGGGDYVAGCMSVCRPSGSAPLSGGCRGNGGCCLQNNVPLGLDTTPTAPTSAASVATGRRPAGEPGDDDDAPGQLHRLLLRVHGGRHVVLARRLQLQPDRGFRRARGPGLGHHQGRPELRGGAARPRHVRVPERAQRLPRV
jgi:hypothetical protein